MDCKLKNPTKRSFYLDCEVYNVCLYCECSLNLNILLSDWLVACRVLAVLALITCFLALVVTSVGLTTDIFHRKYKYYVSGMTLLIIAGMCLLLFVYSFRCVYGLLLCEWVVEWCMFIVNLPIFHLYHGKNKLIFNEMIRLCTRPTRLVGFFSARSLNNRPTWTHYSDSEPTSFCSFPLILCA